MMIQRITHLPPLPDRSADGHKGTFGKVLVIGGSLGMSGAAALAGLGALRGGAGLVYVAVPESIVPTVAAIEPSYLTVPLPETDGRIDGAAIAKLQDLLPEFDAVALGPGIGQSDKLTELVAALFRSVEGPLVLDADALNAFADRFAEHPAEIDTLGARILTPHPGEFARLIGRDIATVENNREELAAEFAARHRVVLVLKGHCTVITDGQRLAINTTGNNGMATGGSGDVLTGLTTALLAQKMSPFEAAQLAVHLHGLAGDLAAEELSQPGMIASDLPRFLPAAWKHMS